MMESMARSISTHSFRIALGSRGVDDGGLMRFCISTSPVGRYRVRFGGSEGSLFFFGGGGWVDRVDQIFFTYHNLLPRSYFGHTKFLLGLGCISRTSALKASKLAQLQL